MRTIVLKIAGILGSGIPLPLFVSFMIAGKIENVSVTTGVALSFFLVYQQILVTLAKGGADQKLMVLAATREIRVKHQFLKSNWRLFTLSFIIVTIISSLLLNPLHASLLVLAVWLEMLSTVRSAELIGYGDVFRTTFANAIKQVGFIVIVYFAARRQLSVSELLLIYVAMCAIRLVLLRFELDVYEPVPRSVQRIHEYSLSSFLNVMCWRADQITLSMFTTYGNSISFSNLEIALQQMKIVEMYSYLAMAVAQVFIGKIKQLNYQEISRSGRFITVLTLIGVTNMVVVYLVFWYLDIDSVFMLLLTTVAATMSFLMNLRYVLDLRDEKIRTINRKFVFAALAVSPVVIFAVFVKNATFLCLTPIFFIGAYLLDPCKKSSQTTEK